MISLWMVGILFFKFEEVIIMSLFSMMLGQINSESNIDDLKDKLEEVKFTLKISGLYLKKIILWILIINLIRYRLYITKTIY